MNTSISEISIISNNARLTDKVVSHFRRGNQYLPIFDVIYGKVPDTGTIQYGVFTNECLRIYNSIKFLKSTIILLIDCQEGVKKVFNDYFSTENVFEISKYDFDMLSTIPCFKENPFNLKLFNQRRNGKKIIAIEKDENDISKVIAQNLAIYSNALLVELTKVTREETDIIKDKFAGWMNSSHSEIRDNLKNEILSYIASKIDVNYFQNKECVTFITRGIPYGFYPFDFPTTHIWIHRSVGLQIVRGIIKSTNSYLHAVASYICDPSSINISETDELFNLYKPRNYTVRLSIGKNATVRNVSNSSTYMPFDFIYYSTHCGNVEGMRVEDTFKTKDGKIHKLRYDEVLSIAPEPNSDMVKLDKFMRFISIDGIRWDDHKGKKKINVGDLLNRYYECEYGSKSENKNIIREVITDVTSVKGCHVLKMYRSNYIPHFHQVGGHRHPIVFNNACSTWHELAIQYAIGGASAYIGTSIDIPNQLAIDVVLKFTASMLSGMPLGKALYYSQKDHIKDFGFSPYLMFGYIDLKVEQFKPRNKISDRFYKILKYEIRSWERYIDSAEIDELKNNAEPIIVFLKEELHKFSRSSLKKSGV